MRTALNTITLGEAVPFETSLEVTSRAGFQGVEIFSIERAKTYSQRKGEDPSDLLKQLSLEPVGFILGGFVYQDAEGFRRDLPRLQELMDFAAGLAARNALLFLPSKNGLSEDEALERATARIAETVDIAGSYGLRVSLEPIGAADFLNTPSDLLPILERIDDRNLGMTIDTFHFFTGGCVVQDLEGIPLDRIFLVHINDSPLLPQSEMDDSKRVLPGQGEMQIVPFLSTLNRRGYQGYLSVELFNRELWAGDPMKVADASKRALDGVMDRAGVSR